MSNRQLQRPLSGRWIIVATLATILACSAHAENGLHTVAGAEGVRIEYVVTGVGDVGLIFVHGWMCDRSYWKKQIAAFSQDYRVVLIDLGGHGGSDSDRDDWSMESFGKDVAAVADAIDVKQIVLVGHSMGGPVVLEAGPRVGDRLIGIIGVDTLRSAMADPMSEEDASVAFAMSAEDFPGRTETFVRSNFFIDGSPPGMIDEIARDMASGDPRVAAKAGTDYVMFNIREALGALPDVPLTLINASSTPTDAVALKNVHPNSTLREISNSGHFVMLENPNEFNSALSDSLQQVLDAL